ncbi:lysophospholipid acyltransferase family protein [Sphingosinicella rhizophila]|uniref:Lysophospholipid acyltransferase family protein n=1 Tax=Sphingosinicella rhizophila TaxID=3050082 RepID=A0ABU3Q573_9SPHN|nr:lysophospholipid acyltransferase family protein [Sphingosinicella sp. GR2756]MDT9598219.1 lysophospholipid acyltransferase family protein [Sphingosinicella sp. GR2756]
MRLTLRIAAITAGLIACTPFHYLALLITGRSAWPRRYLAWVGWSAGMRCQIIGKPMSSNVLFVANHSSWLDIVLLASASGTAFVSKEEVARWPLVGWLARLNRTVFVAREQPRSVKGQADALRTALANGQPVALFPEGTTDGGEEILPFRPSLLAALFPPLPRLRVQPVAIDYGAAATEIAWIGRESARANAMRILSRSGATPVMIHFLDPIDPVDFADRKALAIASRAAILGALPAAGPDGTGGSRLDASARGADRL